MAGALFLGVEAPIAELGDCHDPAVRAATQHAGQLTRREAAERRGVSIARVDRAIAAGELRAAKVGRLVRPSGATSSEPC